MGSKEPGGGGGGGERTALVTGATGITGRHCVDALLRDQGQGGPWRVVTLARRDLQGLAAADAQRVTQVKGDLQAGGGSVAAALRGAGVPRVTHLFHCAYLMKGDPGEECEANLGMLRGVVEGAEALHPSALRHVYCMEGGKWYGQHLSTPLKTPHREDDPPLPPPMFYFDLQGYLEGRVKAGAAWSWSALRPNPVIGFSTGSFMNLGVSIAVYASLCRELGLPFRFPGSREAWEGLVDVCDADLLAEGMLHCATTPACANQAFNISNGDCFRWKDIWPSLADWFGLPVAPPVNMPLVKVMADEGPVWQRLVEEHGLQATPYEQLATWTFADFVFNFPGSWFSTVNALRRTGFHAMHRDSDASLRALFADLRRQRVIP